MLRKRRHCNFLFVCFKRPHFLYLRLQYFILSTLLRKYFFWANSKQSLDPTKVRSGTPWPLRPHHLLDHTGCVLVVKIIVLSIPILFTNLQVMLIVISLSNKELIYLFFWKMERSCIAGLSDSPWLCSAFLFSSLYYLICFPLDLGNKYPKGLVK